MEDTNSILTPEELLRVYSDKIIATIIKNTETAKKNRTYIFGDFMPEMFKDENYLIYYMLYRMRDLNIAPDKEFLEIYLMNNTKVLKDAHEKINLSAFTTEDIDEYTSYIGATCKQFVRLQGMGEMLKDDLKLTMEKYKSTLIAIETGRIYSTAERILTQGLALGKKTLLGYEDSKAYINREFARIESISARDAGEGFIQMRGFQEEDDKKKIRKICNWGIRELDKHFGGIFTSTFISVLAPPKNGKTKFTVQMAHNALMAGESIVVWAIEGGRKAYDAQLRAHHFDYMYNKDIVDIRDKKIGVSAKIIKDNLFKTEQLRALEDASRIDLYNNPNYGEVIYISRDCNVETFIQELDTAVQTVNASLIVIDYLQLMGSKSTSYKKNERIGDAYISLLKYINDKNISVISPAQFTQEFLKDISKSGSEGSIETRGSGGESSEIIRTPDILIALYATEEDLIRNEMSLLSIPSRNAQPFPKFRVGIDLGCCNFYSMPELESA